MSKLICELCEERIEDDGDHVDFNGVDYHQECFENSGGPKYCCGMMYEDGEEKCRSCGEPI